MRNDPFEMPYVRDDGCDICGARGARLKRVILREQNVSQNRRARAAYVCSKHDLSTADPILPPSFKAVAGTDAKHPQRETLFHD